MRTMTRRGFVQAAGAAAGALAAASLAAPAAAPAAPTAAGAGAAPVPFRLGIVTYNIAADWDLPTILKICRNVGIGDVELRTTHKHGVEPSLDKPQRQDVRKRFADAGVNLWGLGTTCEFQSADAAERKRQVELVLPETGVCSADAGGSRESESQCARAVRARSEKDLLDRRVLLRWEAICFLCGGGKPYHAWCL